MKVQVKQKDGIGLTIYLPSPLIGFIVGSPFVRNIILKALQDYSQETPALPEHNMNNHSLNSSEHNLKDYDRKHPDWNRILTPEVLEKAQKKIKHLLKEYKHLQLVDIESADGHQVKIIL